LSVVSKLAVGSLYVEASGSDYTFTVGSSKALTLSSGSGTLHGSWAADAAVVTSDRRLKKEIIPLQRTLRDRGPHASAAEAATSSGNHGGDGALWLLRQLRPVSYAFRKGSESKYMRFGFIADELESVVPEVVRSMGDQEVPEQKAVVYQDLIAILTAAGQSQQHRIEALESTVGDMKAKLQSVEKDTQARLRSLEKVVAVLCRSTSMC